jgi:hypothetical protein
MAAFLNALATRMATTVAEVVATRLEAAVAAAIERCLARSACLLPSPGLLAAGTSARSTGTVTGTRSRANRRHASPVLASPRDEDTERMQTPCGVVAPRVGETSSASPTLRSNGTV